MMTKDIVQRSTYGSVNVVAKRWCIKDKEVDNMKNDSKVRCSMCGKCIGYRANLCDECIAKKLIRTYQGREDYEIEHSKKIDK